MQEFPDLDRTTRHHMMKIGNRFSGVDDSKHRYTVLRELAAPSVPDENGEALQVLVDNQEEERETILLVLGRQLLEGRKGRSKENFGKWVNKNFPNLLETVNNVEVTAILWAAEFPEQHQDMLDKHPRVRTTRGLYAKYKEEQA
jgi:hypothetical protein